jgi:hypothetical protein
MTDWYACILGADGHVIKRVVVSCNDDDEAKHLAKQPADGHAVEPWQQCRIVAIVGPEDE